LQCAAPHLYRASSLRKYRVLIGKPGLEQTATATLALFEELLAQMAASRTDYTRLFRRLSGIKRATSAAGNKLRDGFIVHDRCDRWLQDYRTRLHASGRPGWGTPIVYGQQQSTLCPA